MPNEKIKFIIFNKKTKSYYSNTIMENMYHFVKDIQDAKKFNSFDDANKILFQFKNMQNYEIREY